MSLVARIVAIDRTVADLARTEAFYRDSLGFSRLALGPVPPPILDAMGLAGGRAIRLTMRLGDQRMTFMAVDPPGLPYPDAPLSTDPVFQHAAIPVRDMGSAFDRLRTAGPGPITQGGPQVLPEESGGVAAFKFRDPDGHPLELIHFPDGPAAETWREAPGLFLGIDHSAITVTDRTEALAFFEHALGLRVAHLGLNHGLEQGRLDGIAAPEVDVIALDPTGSRTPHMELLHYRQPPTTRPTPAPFGPRDRATTRFVFAVPDLPACMAAIRAAGYQAALSQDGAAAYAEGPDGHGMLFVPSGT